MTSVPVIRFKDNRLGLKERGMDVSCPKGVKDFAPAILKFIESETSGNAGWTIGGFKRFKISAA